MIPVLLALLQSPDSGGVFNGRERQLDVTIPRLEAAATLDGVLDEPVWRQAARLTGFSQYRPVDGRPAADSTEVLVWYTADAIYFGIRAFEGHGAVVRATLADRDNISTDDNVQILLDTFNDRRRALLFSVNPFGVQEDGVRSEGLAGAAGGANAGFRFDGVIDLNPDYVYQSRGRLTPGGYEVEVRIPFKSIRYQSAARQDWGLQIIRTTQHSGYEDTWTPVVRANASFLIQSGALKDLSDLRRGLVMDVTPEFTSRVDGGPATPDYQYGHVTPEVGATLRWGLTQNLSLTATANPDFSQVEADVGQVTLNQRFALFFPEKRPFFLEGLEQFDTPNALIYTRRIAAPIAGAKLTGKLGSTAVAYIGAVDEENTAGDHPLINLLRLRRDFGASSTVGFAYTDRIEGDAYNRVFATDARVIWKKIWFSEVQFAGSWGRNGGGGAGKLWDLTFYDRTGRSYGNHAEIVGISPEFSAANGFVNRTGFVNARIANRFSWYGKPGALLEQATTFILMTPLWRYDDFLKGRSTIEGGIQETWLFTVRGGWGLNAQWANNQQRFDAGDYATYATDGVGTPFPIPHGLYNLWAGNVGANSPNRALTASVNVGYGAAPIFAEAARGREFNAFLGLTWKPTPSLRLDGRWVHDRITRSRDGSRFSTANIPRLKLEYQLTRAIFFRYVGQYLSQDQTALVDPRTGQPLYLFDAGGGTYVQSQPQVVNDFRNDFLFSYRPTPGTVLFFGYGASLGEPDAFAFRSLKRTGDGFFLKASYLFRM